MVNQAAVLTLWAEVVAEVLGFEHDEALTLGRTVTGLNAYFKGIYLALFLKRSMRKLIIFSFTKIRERYK